MRKYIILAAAIILVVGTSHAVELGADDFSYADGSLIDNPPWVSHSGTLGDLLVAGGQAVVQHGIPSEDANYPFAAQTAGEVFFGIDFTVTSAAAISGADNEYFAHFKDSSFGFTARMDIVAPNVAGGDFTVGISSDTSTAQATWATDLAFGTTYRAVARYNIDTDYAELWIDASADTDTSIVGTVGGSVAYSVESFALRQSDSAENEAIAVDNLMIGTTFADVVVYVPVELQSFSIE